jgi:organic hydroperoxide reductase OsmC/OhrA
MMIYLSAKVGMIQNGIGAFSRTVALDVTIAGVAQAVAEQVVADVHKVCPYSNAVKGNIEVTLSTRTS